MWHVILCQKIVPAVLSNEGSTAIHVNAVFCGLIPYQMILLIKLNKVNIANYLWYLNLVFYLFNFIVMITTDDQLHQHIEPMKAEIVKKIQYWRMKV